MQTSRVVQVQSLLHTYFMKVVPMAFRNFGISLRYEADDLNRKIMKVKMSFLIAVLLTLSFLCVFWAVIPTHPNGQEMILSLISTVGYWVNVVLIVSAGGMAVVGLLCLLGVGVWNFGKGIKYEFKPSEQAALPSGHNLGNDVPVFSLSPNETSMEFRVRMDYAVGRLKEGQRAVVVAYRIPVGLIVEAGRETQFPREKPPFSNKVWTDAHKTVTDEQGYIYESWHMYQDYITDFQDQFIEWSMKDKLAESQQPQKTFTQLLERK